MVQSEAAIEITLESASKSLSGPSQHPLHVCGQFTGIFSHVTKEVHMEEEIFIVQGLPMFSLGCPAIKRSQLGSNKKNPDFSEKGDVVVV